MPGKVEREHHWEDIYATRDPAQLSWQQRAPAVSLRLVERSGIPREAPILDAGGGASPLAGALLDAGYRDVTVLDLSASALTRAFRSRYGLSPRRLRTER